MRIRDMRTKLRGKFTLLFMMFGLLLAIPAVALADDIRDGLDISAQQTQTITAGDSTSIGFTNQYWIVANNANIDGVQIAGCDVVAEGDSITATFKVNTPAGVTASVSSLTFDECRAGSDLNSQPVKFTSNTPGTYTFPALTKTSGAGTYTTANTAFTLVVNDNCPSGDTSGNLQDGKCTANTPPQVSVSGVTNGDSYEHGAVPAADCNVTDAEDTNESANPVKDSSGLNSYGLGSEKVTCTYTDGGGVTKSASASYNIVDTTKPNIAAHGDVTAEATGPNGAEVTYTAPTASDAVYSSVDVECLPASGSQFDLGDTTVTCTATDGSGNEAIPTTFKVTVADTKAPVIAAHDNVTAEATGPDGANVSYTSPGTTDAVDGNKTANCTPASGSKFDLGDTTVTCNATDAAGNEAIPTTFKVTVADTTKPELNLPDNITQEATGPNGNAVTFNATASDLVSGNVNVDCSPASGSTFPIATTTVNCSATDAAGNKATGSFTVKVQDTIAPSNIQFVGGPAADGSYFFGETPLVPTCTATDSGSGLNSAGCVVSGYSTAVGTHTLKATATDKAGNIGTKEISYTVKPYTLNGFYQPIDMNDTVNTVKNGSTVPVKFELFKGATELTSTSAVTSIKATPITCGALAGDPEDAIETVATGGTSLRYDATAGQFIYNWTTPKGASQVGKCYTLTMTAADSSSITAYFKLK